MSDPLSNSYSNCDLKAREGVRGLTDDIRQPFERNVSFEPRAGNTATSAWRTKASRAARRAIVSLELFMIQQVFSSQVNTGEHNPLSLCAHLCCLCSGTFDS